MGRRFTRGQQDTVTAVAPIQTNSEHNIINGKKESRRKKKKGRNKENKKVKGGLFPRQKDGFTSLSIIPPAGEGIIPGTEKDRPMSLGHLIGRVRVGTSYLYGFREDKRNLVKSMYPISYNFFSSYGPTYDSTFSSLTLEETQLVQTGDRFYPSHGKQFADIIKNVCNSKEDYSHQFVDRLLNILEGNSKQDDTSLQYEDVTSEPQTVNDCDLIDFDALKTLSEEGIDMSFVDNLKTEYEAKEAEEDAKRTHEERLDRTAHLINNLKSSQTKRLNVCPNYSLNQVEQPSDFEMKLASKVLDNLTTILQATKPGDLVGVSSVRRAMGVNLPTTEEIEKISAPATNTSHHSSPTNQTQSYQGVSNSERGSKLTADGVNIVTNNDSSNKSDNIPNDNANSDLTNCEKVKVVANSSVNINGEKKSVGEVVHMETDCVDDDGAAPAPPVTLVTSMTENEITVQN